jgi:hypothetical protein
MRKAWVYGLVAIATTLMGAEPCPPPASPPPEQELINGCIASSDTCRVVWDDGDDGLIATELQRAWNELVFVEGATEFALLLPSSETRYEIERRVHWCGGTAPADLDDAPDCTDAPRFAASVLLMGGWDLTCEISPGRQQQMQNPIVGGHSDVCLWIGSASVDGQGPIDPLASTTISGDLDISTGVSFAEMIQMNTSIFPLYCDGCGSYEELTLRHSLEPDASGGYGPVLVGGTGNLTIWQPSDIQEQAAPSLRGPHHGTVVHGEVAGVTVGNCNFDGQLYDCELELASDLFVHGRVIWNDEGSLRSEATVVAGSTSKPVYTIGSGQPFGDIEIGGTIWNDNSVNSCIRINGKVWEWADPPTVELSATCRDTKFYVGCSPIPNNGSAPQDPLALQSTVDIFSLTPEAAFAPLATNDWQHMFPQNGFCGLSAPDSGLVPAATLPSTLPSAPAPLLVGTAVDEVVNGTLNNISGGSPASLTVNGVNFGGLGIVVGDRVRFTAGDLAGIDRIIVAIDPSGTLTLSDAPLSAPDGAGAFADVTGWQYEIVRPRCYDFTTGNVVFCGTGDTRRTAGSSQYVHKGNVTVTAAVPSDVSCDLTWVRNGGTVPDMIGAEWKGVAAPREDASVTLGGYGDVLVEDDVNMYSPLRAVGDSETRQLGDGLDPGDTIELQITPGPGDACVDAEQQTGPCGCFGGAIGGVTASVQTVTENLVADFPEPQPPPQP